MPEDQTPISKSFLIKTTLLLVVLGILPFWIAWKTTPQGMEFSGALVNPDDMSIYLSAVRQGREGELLFHFNSSPETIAPRITHATYMAVGFIGRLTGLSNILLFHIYRILAGVFSFASVYYLCRRLFPSKEKLQYTALLFLTFSSGIGWFLSFLVSWGNPILADLNVPEWNFISALLSAPHFIFAVGLEVLIINLLVQIDEKRQTSKLLAAGFLTSTLLGLTYAFHNLTLLTIAFAFLAVSGIQRKSIPWKTAASFGVVLFPQIAFLIYYGQATVTDGAWSASHIQNNLITPPPPLGIMAGLGILALLALLGVRPWLRSDRSMLIPVWAAANLLMIYLPLPFSGRFILGLFVPVSMLAAAGLEESFLPRIKSSGFYQSFSKMTPTPQETLRRMIILLTIPSTLLFLLWTVRSAILVKDFPNYYAIQEIKAAEFLAGRASKEDIILAHYPIGNYLPRIAPARAFLGHLNLTLDLDDKMALLEKFWDADTSNAWREAFVEKWEINYIYSGSAEKLLQSQPVQLPFPIIYNKNEIIIYDTGLDH